MTTHDEADLLAYMLSLTDEEFILWMLCKSFEEAWVIYELVDDHHMLHLKTLCDVVLRNWQSLQLDKPKS